MCAARYDFQFGAFRQAVQAGIHFFIIQIRILISADDEGRCPEFGQVNRVDGAVHAEISSASVGAELPVEMPAAGAPPFPDHRICDFFIDRSVFVPLEIIRCVVPGIMVKRFCNCVLSYAAQDRGIKDQPVNQLRMGGRKAADRHGSPAPSQKIDRLLPGFCNDLFRRGMDVFRGIVGIRHKAILHFFGLAESGYVQKPDAISLSCQLAHQAVILVINIEFMGGVGHSVDQQDLSLRLCPAEQSPGQMQVDSVPLKRNHRPAIFFICFPFRLVGNGMDRIIRLFRNVCSGIGRNIRRVISFICSGMG